MKAHNAIETATNTVENTLVVEELSDADLMAINGGEGPSLGGGVVDPLLAVLQQGVNGLFNGLLGR